MAAQLNVVNDVGTLLKIPNKALEELIDKLNLCIGSIIYDAKMQKEENVVINIGIGALSVNLADMQCKFLPSKSLKTAIKRSLTSTIDPLELVIEEAVAQKLIAACEEAL